MPNRRNGFLGDSQRNLIDSEAGTPKAEVDILSINEGEGTVSLSTKKQRRQALSDEVKNPEQTKSELKTGVTTPGELRDVLQGFREDLWRVREFYCHVREQPGGRYEWEDEVLPQIADELNWLAELCSGWSDKAEDTPGDYVRAEVANAIAPLFDSVETTPSERTSRRLALTAILKDGELRKILEWIAANPGKKIPERYKGNKSWKWWAGSRIREKHELVEESAWGFELTERGESVVAAWRGLQDASVVAGMTDDTRGEAMVALHLLSHHFDKEGYPDASSIEEL